MKFVILLAHKLKKHSLWSTYWGVCMCGFFNVWVCMCGFCNVWVCVCVGFVMCGCFGNTRMSTSFYCVFVLFRLCILILICY